MVKYTGTDNVARTHVIRCNECGYVAASAYHAEMHSQDTGHTLRGQLAARNVKGGAYACEGCEYHSESADAARKHEAHTGHTVRAKRAQQAETASGRVIMRRMARGHGTQE